MGYLLRSTQLFLPPLYQYHQLKLLWMLIWILSLYWKLSPCQSLVLNLRREWWVPQLCSRIHFISSILHLACFLHDYWFKRILFGLSHWQLIMGYLLCASSSNLSSLRKFHQRKLLSLWIWILSSLWSLPSCESLVSYIQHGDRGLLTLLPWIHFECSLVCSD